MKKILLLAVSFMVAAASFAQSAATVKPIETNVPARPAGQLDVINLTAPKMNVVRVGFVGLGMRGPGAVTRFSNIENTDIKALCDVETGRAEKCQDILTKYGRHKADVYAGSADAYKKLCERKDIDLVYIATDWVHHVPVAKYAMEHGKHVAIEVPAATSLDEIWDLINTSERTRKHCMMLENCVYDFFEVSALNMAREGLFGDVIHVEGSYLHNLDDFWGEYWNNWRLDFNRKHRGDVYPTHGIGPDCQVLGIHRTDLMDYLVAMDTKPVNGPRAVKKYTGEDCTDFQNGDQTSTLIRTMKGRTMLIQHDVLTPRPYSRMYQIVGSDGYASKYPIEEILLRQDKAKRLAPNHENLSSHSSLPAALRDSLLAAYTPDYVKEISEKAKKVGGHGGMDYIMDYRLVHCLLNGLPLDMDVYDMAEWCCIGELSRISMENGSAPVKIPDFTRGAWTKSSK